MKLFLSPLPYFSLKYSHYTQRRKSKSFFLFALKCVLLACSWCFSFLRKRAGTDNLSIHVTHITDGPGYT